MRRRWLHAGRVLAVLALAGVVAVAWRVVAESRDDLDDSSIPAPSTEVELVAGALTDRQSVILVVSEASPLQVAFPGQGRVSQLLLQAGTSLSADTVWGRVDGRPRVIAPFESNGAFYRDLEPGARGSDVVLLQEFLNSRGATLIADGKFGSTLKTALATYFEGLTAEKHDGVLRLGDLGFLPAGLTVKSVDVTPGEAITDGAVVAQFVGDQLRFTFRVDPALGSQIALGSSVAAEEFSGTVVSSETVVPTDTANQPEGGESGPEVVFTVEGTPTRSMLVGESFRSEIILSQSEASILAPAGAVSITGLGQASIVLVDGTELDVTTGNSADGWIEILEGAQAGQRARVPHPDAIVSGG